MYDYLSLQANPDFSVCIELDQFNEALTSLGVLIVRSNASRKIRLGKYEIIIQGIQCDRNGNYSFDDDSVFEKINLIEINIPQGAESEYEQEIAHITRQLANKIGWQIDWRE